MKYYLIYDTKNNCYLKRTKYGGSWQPEATQADIIPRNKLLQIMAGNKWKHWQAGKGIEEDAYWHVPVSDISLIEVKVELDFLNTYTGFKSHEELKKFDKSDKYKVDSDPEAEITL